ncbi:membrane protein [Marinobacter psychrophilus]|jgi:drug/metabolite transporter (DMT)-like permease|uniref:Membrane protein n=1 Tax=Marinobacter psychrophilus TaxID=330734 RepID=A0A0H4I3D6_9GAMM|nr:DMT family transporter [Marinobacter psychrophilus]AKO52298.1 membrane protein [Marinobacter psychrophilus]
MRIIILTTLAMIAFASNSVLARMALKHTDIDAASFTAIRLISGAIVLLLVVRISNRPSSGSGSWWSAAALFAYAAGFSFAYVSLPTATGALLLFGAVQVTMIVYGFWAGERLLKLQLAGLALAFGGLLLLFLPGLSTTPPVASSLLMLGAGICWGVYSLRGRSAGNPVHTSAGNFTRAVAFAVVLSFFMLSRLSLDVAGIWYAIISGALTSGLGYVVWYMVLPMLKATNAAVIQLSVPVIAAVGGVVFLGEFITLRLVLASAAILGGIALVIVRKPSAQVTRQNIGKHFNAK